MTAEEHTTCKRGNGHLQETVVTPPGVVEEHDEQAIGAANNCQLMFNKLQLYTEPEPCNIWDNTAIYYCITYLEYHQRMINPVAPLYRNIRVGY
jgi:hypothetical protein